MQVTIEEYLPLYSVVAKHRILFVKLLFSRWTFFQGISVSWNPTICCSDSKECSMDLESGKKSNVLLFEVPKEKSSDCSQGVPMESLKECPVLYVHCGIWLGMQSVILIYYLIAQANWSCHIIIMEHDHVSRQQQPHVTCQAQYSLLLHLQHSIESAEAVPDSFFVSLIGVCRVKNVAHRVSTIGVIAWALPLRCLLVLYSYVAVCGSAVMTLVQ